MRIQRRAGSVWAVVDRGIVRAVFQGLGDARRFVVSVEEGPAEASDGAMHGVSRRSAGGVEWSVMRGDVEVARCVSLPGAHHVAWALDRLHESRKLPLIADSEGEWCDG